MTGNMPEAFAPMQVRTLADRVYDVMRDRILSGAMAGGEPIRQDTIAADLGISKIPLREALTRLDHDGLVRSFANRGYVVSPPSAAEAEEVFALRMKLEPDAAVAASRVAGPADHAAARTALAALGRHIDAFDPRQGVSNREFHMALVRPGAGPITVSLIERLNILADRYVRLHLCPVGRMERAKAEHAEILRCWTEKDLDRLRLLCARHVAGTLSDLRQQLG